MNKIMGFFILFFCLISCTSKPVLTPLDAEDEFARAKLYFENKKYDGAAQAFERIIFFYPSSEFVDDAQYWLGRSYFEKKDYDQAIIEFDYLIRNFKNSSFFEETYLYRAKAYILKAPNYTKDQTELVAALGLLDEYLTMFPNSSSTNEVKDLIRVGRDRLAKKEVENGKLYMKLNYSRAAFLYFDYVLETYPETEASSEAKYYKAKLYEKRGELDAALNLYKELLDTNNWKEKAEKRIKEIEKRIKKENPSDAG